MTTAQDEPITAKHDTTTSAGHDLSGAGWLDQHFIFSRSTYAAMVRWVGFQSGWHVLDAGCGGGSFLPLLAEHIGPMGRLSALDIAPENITAVEARVKARLLPCPFEARVGSVLSLPYADHTFDAVWNANVSQYLTDDELRQMLAEFRRVVKPGGLVAVRDSTMRGNWMSTIPTFMYWHFHEAFCRSGNLEWLGFMRASELAKWLRAAGLTDVRHQFFGIEKNGLLNANDHAFLATFHMWMANYALKLDLPLEDRQIWQQLADLPYVEQALNTPDFYVRGEYIQTVGRVP